MSLDSERVLENIALNIIESVDMIMRTFKSPKGFRESAPYIDILYKVRKIQLIEKKLKENEDD